MKLSNNLSADLIIFELLFKTNQIYCDTMKWSFRRSENRIFRIVNYRIEKNS